MDVAWNPRQIVVVGMDVGNGRWAEVERTSRVKTVVREVHAELVGLRLVKHIESLLQSHVRLGEPRGESLCSRVQSIENH